MIGDEVWDQVREAWFASIPEQYRYSGKERGNHHGRHLSSALILSPPPKPLLDRWFANIKQHLTKDQLRAKAAREACGRSGCGVTFSVSRANASARAKPGSSRACRLW